MTNKLFRVEVGGNLGPYYVVATDPTNAYQAVKSMLDKRDLGFRHQRQLSSVTLLAEDADVHLGTARLLIVPQPNVPIMGNCCVVPCTTTQPPMGAGGTGVFTPNTTWTVSASHE